MLPTSTAHNFGTSWRILMILFLFCIALIALNCWLHYKLCFATFHFRLWSLITVLDHGLLGFNEKVCRSCTGSFDDSHRHHVGGAGATEIAVIRCLALLRARWLAAQGRTLCCWREQVHQCIKRLARWARYDGSVSCDVVFGDKKRSLLSA